MNLSQWLRRRSTSAGDPSPAKWLPRIATDFCTGCGRCERACPFGCLEMVWSFATLARPEDCTGEGACLESCREGWIRMAWAPCEGDPAVGRWR